MDESSKQAHNGHLSGVKKGTHPVNLVTWHWRDKAKKEGTQEE